MLDVKRTITLGIVVLAFGSGLYKVWQQPALSFGFRMPAFEPSTGKSEQESTSRRYFRRDHKSKVPMGSFSSHFASSRQGAQVHASSLVELKDGRLRAFWFSGSREGASDVTINTAVFNPESGEWGSEQVIASRSSTQRALRRYVAKLGNPVAAYAADGTLRLFYVTVSLGGWAGSSITMMTSNDDGETWAAPRRLITSPFINISTLVKGTPFLYADGTMGLPVYHEFVSKFAEMLHLDAAGNVIDKQRLALGGQGTLQPVVLVKSSDKALVLMRYAGKDNPRQARSLSTGDGGRHWGAVTRTSFPNPNSALSGVALADGRLLAVMNNQENGRDSLSLMLSADGGDNWKEIHRMEEMRVIRNKNLEDKQCLRIVQGLLQNSDKSLAHVPEAAQSEYVDSANAWVMANGSCRFEFSYPYMIQARNGDIHLVYTWNRVFIKHVVFDQTWLNHRSKKGADAKH